MGKPTHQLQPNNTGALSGSGHRKPPNISDCSDDDDLAGVCAGADQYRDDHPDATGGGSASPAARFRHLSTFGTCRIGSSHPWPAATDPAGTALLGPAGE